jgi:hypothetical protein
VPPERRVSDVVEDEFLDGEADAATNILENDQRTLRRLETQVDNSRGKTDIDVDIEDGTGIEVKNRNYDNVPDYAEDRVVDDLTEKMKVYAEARDTIVIAARSNPKDSDILQRAKQNVRADYPNTEVRIVNIDDLDSL